MIDLDKRYRFRLTNRPVKVNGPYYYVWPEDESIASALIWSPAQIEDGLEEIPKPRAWVVSREAIRNCETICMFDKTPNWFKNGEATRVIEWPISLPLPTLPEDFK